MKLSLLPFLVALLLGMPAAVYAAAAGSSRETIDFVKSSFFSGYEGITVGEILDKYSYCTSPKWETDRDIYGNFVIFSCEMACDTGMCPLEAKFRVNRKKNAMSLSYIRLAGYRLRGKTSYEGNVHMLEKLIANEEFEFRNRTTGNTRN